MELWPFIPQREFIESLEWLTDVIRCRGGEQRLALRTAPRHGYQYTSLLDPHQFSKAKSFARARSAEEILVPLWGELTYIGALAYEAEEAIFDTSFAHYAVGGLAMVWQADDYYEIVEVATLTEEGLTFTQPLEKNYVAALVAPVKAGIFAQPFEVSRVSGDYLKGSVRFTSVETEDLAGATDYPIYLDHDVMLDRPVLTNDIRERFERETELADNGTGLIQPMTEHTYPIQTSALSWSTLTKEELWKLRIWLHTRRGRWKGFWTPSWNKDLQLMAPVVSADTSLKVKRIGYPQQEGTRDIMIVTTSGSLIYKRILGGGYWSSTQESLTLSEPIGADLAPSDIDMICFLTFMRLDADRIEIRHKAAHGVTVTVPVFEAPIP